MINAIAQLRPQRKIQGISAILLPFTERHEIDWTAFDAHLLRTAAAGLTPAVNMDTGYVHLLSEADRLKVLERSRTLLGGESFVAGAFVTDEPEAKFNFEAYAAAIEAIQSFGGVPVIFPSHGLTHQSDDAIVASYESIGKLCDQFIGFELGPMFAPFGKIYSLDVFRGLLKTPQCTGAKHSSLRRDLEWQRLALRDELRPDFRVYTGNDLAIDMVMYGSDYLLGLSTFAPDLFAKRDSYWESGDPHFYELNDALQYLGDFAFRAPVPAYKHSAAMFLKLRGWIGCDATHPRSPTRPDSDHAILMAMLPRLGI